jgi:excisionase family DNA binding protein
VEKDTYTTREIAAIYGVDMSTIYRWLRNGLVPGAEKTPGRSWVIWKQPFDAHRAAKKEAA